MDGLKTMNFLLIYYSRGMAGRIVGEEEKKILNGIFLSRPQLFFNTLLWDISSRVPSSINFPSIFVHFHLSWLPYMCLCVCVRCMVSRIRMSFTVKDWICRLSSWLSDFQLEVEVLVAVLVNVITPSANPSQCWDTHDKLQMTESLNKNSLYCG